MELFNFVMSHICSESAKISFLLYNHNFIFYKVIYDYKIKLSFTMIKQLNTQARSTLLCMFMYNIYIFF